MRDYIGEFLDVKATEDGVSVNTLQAYKRDIVKFAEFVGDKDLCAVKDCTIEQYLNSLRMNNNSPKTISRKISCIREFYKFLLSERIIDTNPTNKIRTPKVSKGLPNFLTFKEVKELYNIADKEKNLSFKRMKVMIKIMYSCGLRVSEVVSLPLNSVNYELRQILVLGKGCKERVVPINNETVKEIQEYLEYRHHFIKNNTKNKWMFPSLSAISGHITRGAFFKSLKSLAIKAGINPSKVYPHVLRHSFATRLVNSNADLRSIQKMLGHENIATTEIYTHITTQKLAEEVKLKHPLMRKITKGDND